MKTESTYQDSTAFTIPERIADFLRSNRPKAYCDDCIATALSMRREQVNTVTSTLSLCREYSRGGTTCIVCKRDRKFATHYQETENVMSIRLPD